MLEARIGVRAQIASCDCPRWASRRSHRLRIRANLFGAVEVVGGSLARVMVHAIEAFDSRRAGVFSID